MKVSKVKGMGKREVAPYVWETPPAADMFPIFSIIGTAAMWDEWQVSIKVTDNERYIDHCFEVDGDFLRWGYEVEELCEMYNDGVRWVTPKN